jgi:signal recognition particle subunit SEC65
MRDFLREQIQPRKVEQVSGSRQLAEYAAGMREWESEREARLASEAAAAAKPKPQSLVEELRFELEKHQEDSEYPALNSDALLRIAAGTQEAPRSVREQISGLLRGMWDQREQQP